MHPPAYEHLRVESRRRPGTAGRNNAGCHHHPRRGEACFAVTEPDGLNTANIKTFAWREGDRYVLRGQKIWISTAQVADKMLILARTAAAEAGGKPTDGLSLFYTDLDRRYV